MSLMYDIYDDDANTDRGNHVVTAPKVRPLANPGHGPATSDGRCVYCGEQVQR